MKKRFNLREARRLVECVDRQSATTTYEMYFGISRREIPTIKGNVKQIKYLLEHWDDLEIKKRYDMLHSAIWEGKDFSKKKRKQKSYTSRQASKTTTMSTKKKRGRPLGSKNKKKKSKKK